MITTLLLAAALQTMPMQSTTPAQTMPDPAATPATDVPRCSATVTDSCMEGGGMARKSMHHAMHKKMMHKKMSTTAPTK